MSAHSVISEASAAVRIDDRLAKRNAVVLAVAQALGGANPAIVVSLGGLVGQMLADDKHWRPAGQPAAISGWRSAPSRPPC